MDFLSRFESWATQAPQRLAYRNLDRSWTYGDLRSAADALATWLSDELGPSREPIAVYGHKEPEMLACFLASAKVGRAYVPIDATLPVARIRQVLEASKTPLLLAPRALPNGCEVDSLRVVQRDAIAEVIASRRGRTPSPDTRVRGGDDFYVMFTSGSTGTPKGVRITHDNVDTFLAWGRTAFAVPDGSRFLNQVPFSFDVSVMDSYNALSTGGSVSALDRELALNPLALFEELVRSNPEVWVSTPSFVELCLANPRVARDALPALHTVLLCGEVLTNDCARRLLQRFPGVSLFNTYGPTEATVAVTAVRVDAGLVEAHSPLPLGRAKPDLYVGPLTESGAHATDGTRGEIVIEGSSVGPGYLGAPELTQRSFYTIERNGTVYRGYRTGDLGYLQDGSLFYCGRVDAQVKLHGHRIELEDVESHLRAIAGVENAVVLPHVSNGRCESLTAVLLCASPDKDPRAFAAEVRAALGARLPAYMVPQKFITCRSFPMSVNGKINRKQMAADLAARPVLP
jgi:D-alanine--poly(phosphoribitol) ligase subunit 1